MLILDDILKWRNKNTNKNAIPTELSAEQKEFMEPYFFDRMPKTDYTYSRSPSYSRRYLNRSYKIPNMSRRLVRSGTSLVEDISDVYSSEEEDGYISSPSTEMSETYVTSRTVIEDGMLLRSGKGIQNAKEIFEEHERAKMRKSTGRVSSAVSSRSRGRLSLASDMVTSTNMLKSQQSRSSVSQRVRTKVRKTLVQEFEETEMEKGMKEAANEKSRISQRTSLHSLDHLYGLDSEVSGIESEEECTDSSRKNYSYNASRRQETSQTEEDLEDISTLTTVTTTVVTTIIERVSAVTSPVVTPMWNTVGSPVWNAVGRPVWTHVFQPMWTYIGQPAYHGLSSTILTTVTILQYLVSQAILLDTWLLSRKKNGCCLCLPLLLLLPLLMLSGIVPNMQNLSSVLSTRQHLQEGISVSSDQVLNTINLQEEVKRIIIQLQSSSQNQLTEADVERIVAGKIATELSALKLDLAEKENQHVAAEMRKNNEQAMKLQHLHTSLVSNITLVEQKMEMEKQNLETVGAAYHSQSSNVLNQLGEDLTALQAKLKGVELSQQMLEIQMKNCCRNDSVLAAFIHDHISTILVEVMGGHESGNGPQDAFMVWLHNNYVSRKDLEERMSLMAADITRHILAEQKKGMEPSITITNSGGGADISEQLIRTIVDDALLKYSADKIGLPDFALESSGGSVISTRCSETYHKKTAQYSIMGIPLWYASNSPRTVIQPEVHPGSCWAFQGSQGHLVVELSTIITPTGFSLEHIPKSVAPNGKIDSAPKDFLVQGMTGEKDVSGKVLGNYTYNDDGRPLQFFPIQVSDPGFFKFVELKILSNHGSPVFTCVYRFRVHGSPYTG
ncbi:SUN domain-containing protein 2-like isoform X2 [Mizuhopecten yessoensis]|uniref:SUN domain-containing protein 2-like isoform X2 n=1 Tax=Mizuhopecten yessoensis TaxID=6573 RepID=UPI000B45B1D8|nr:SUN domain-containing protein 2-like isoform X2 [Mizuhopecten yessoensis]